MNVAGEKLSAHKFVLAARSDVWSLANLTSTSELDLSGEQPWCDLTVLKSNLNQNENPVLYTIFTYVRQHAYE